MTPIDEMLKKLSSVPGTVLGITAGRGTDLSGFSARLERLRERGFNGLDIQDLLDTDSESSVFRLDERGFESFLTEERRVAESLGFRVTQAHGPWRWPSDDGTPEKRAERFGQMSRAIRGTAMLGCPFAVIHYLMPWGRTDEDEAVTREINLDYFGRLAEVGREYGVTVCLENMPFHNQFFAKPEKVLELVKAIGHPNLSMCLDTGHCAVHGISPADAARLLGKRYLSVMHVHDNNGERDQHLFPGNGVVDWDAYLGALREIGFTGAVSLETSLPEEA